MRKLLLCFIYLFALLPFVTMAEERQALTLHLTNQSKVQLVLPEQNPYIVVENGLLIVEFRKNANDTDWQSLEYSREQIVNLDFEVVDYDGVEEVVGQDNIVRFDLTRKSVVRVSGLQDKDRLQVVSLDGKAIQVPVSRQDGEAIVDLSGQSSGCYVVSVNRGFTFKLMKK